jgi:hypothetical protein
MLRVYQRENNNKSLLLIHSIHRNHSIVNSIRVSYIQACLEYFAMYNSFESSMLHMLLRYDDVDRVCSSFFRFFFPFCCECDVHAYALNVSYLVLSLIINLSFSLSLSLSLSHSLFLSLSLSFAQLLVRAVVVGGPIFNSLPYRQTFSFDILV